MTNKSKIIGSILFLIAIVLLFMSASLIENNPAGRTQVKQAFLTGKMTVHSESGVFGQLLGTLEPYTQVITIGFGEEKGDGTANIGAIPVMFNDGSKAMQSGIVRIKLPMDHNDMIKIKQTYIGGERNLIQSGLVPIIKNAVKRKL